MRPASLAVAGLLAGLALTDRLASQGARIGPVSGVSFGPWIVAAAVLAFLLAKPETRPLRAGSLLASLVVIGLTGWLLLEWRQLLFEQRTPLQALVVDGSTASPKLVRLPLRVDGRRELGRMLGRRPRQISVSGAGVLYAPTSGTYRFELSCDDRCRIGLDQRWLQEIAGSGFVETELASGFHELRIVYEQSEGPARFALAWDRPGAVELLGLERYVGQDRHAVDPEALRRDQAQAVALLLSEAILFSLAFGWLLRAGEHVRAHPEYRGLLLGNAAVTWAAAGIFARAALPHSFATGAVLAGGAVAAGLLARSTLGLPLERPRATAKTALVIAAAALLAVLVDQHVSGLNGPEYWRWPWRRLGGPSLYLAMSVPLIGFFSAQRHFYGARGSLPAALSLLMVSNLALQIIGTGMVRSPFGLQEVARRLMDPGIGSYYVEAARVGELGPWLRSYPRLSASFHSHAQTKPPGPILFYRAFLSTLGEGANTARVAGLAIGVLACLAIPASFLLIRLLSGSAAAGFAGASFLALSPGPVLFFPQLDQTYAILSCALVGSWVLALTRRRLAYAAVFGLVLSLALFTSYSLLALGLFLGLVSLSAVASERVVSLRFAFSATTAALGAVMTLYAVLFWVTGFDPLQTFSAALANQAKILPSLGRPYPASVAFDLLDFSMGAGWISVLLLSFFLIENARAGSASACWRVAVLALVQIVGLAWTGLIQTETVRVWQFLLPLFLCPVGCELAGWRPAARNAVYLSLWFLTATLCRNMAFIR